MNRRIFLTLIAVAMAVLMAVITPLQSFVMAESISNNSGTRLYVSEVRMSQTKSWLTENGYTVVDNELNAKTKEDDVYIGYKTTTNPDEAVTDIAVMRMNGGFYRTDYRKMMEEYSLQLSTMTDELIIAIEEFRTNYTKGSPAAKAAYKVLNYLYVDDVNNRPFGDWVVSGEYTRELLFDMIMMCDQTILTLIYNQLAVGCQYYAEETWIEKLSAFGTGKGVVYDDNGKPIWQDLDNGGSSSDSGNGEPSDIEPYVPEELSDEDYYDGAYSLKTAIEIFARICNKALLRRDANQGQPVLPSINDKEELQEQYESEDTKLTFDELTDASDGDIITLGVYDFLSSYQYGDGTVADLFMHEEVEELSVLYPIVKVLTPGQLVMMKLVGISVMASTATNTEEAYANLDAVYDELSEGLTCSVWNGANRAVYEGEIGVTDAARRQMSASGDFRALTSDKETLRDKAFLLAMCVGVALCATVAVQCIISTVVSLVGAVASYSITSAAFSFCLTATIVASAFTYVSIFIAAIVVIVLLVALTDYIIEWYDEYHPEYTSIPDIMYDMYVVDGDDGEKVEYVRYDAVPDEGGNPGDLNAWEGREWNAVYTTKDPAAGSPIVADEDGEVFYVQYDNGTTPNGFEPMHYFGYKYAMDTNDYVFDHNIAIYVFYHTLESYYGEASGDPNNDTSKTRYLREVYLECRSSGESARYSLENKGFTVVNMDLTPFSDDSTYLGYKTTTNPKLALTDIRLAYAHNAESYMFGEASYGNYGTTKQLTLYAAKYACAGSPILADIYATKTVGAPLGYEPISLFSGGSAFNIAIVGEREYPGVELFADEALDYDDWADYNTFLYYKPSVTYTEGPDYISGFTFFQYNLLVGRDGSVVWNAFEWMQEILGVTSTGYDVFRDGDRYAYSLMHYTTTKNPYRALRAVKSYSIDDEEGSLSQNMTLGGIGFSAVQPYSFYNDGTDGFRWIDKGNTYISQRVTEGMWLNGNAEGATGMYVTTAASMGTPFTYEDILFTNDNSTVPDGYTPVTSIKELFTDSAADIAKGNGGGIYLYMYIKGQLNPKPQYISSIVLTEKSGDEGYNQLLAYACNEICDNQIGISDKLMVGLVRSPKKSQAIRDIRYVLTETSDRPSTSTRIDGITYNLVSDKCTYMELNRESQDPDNNGYYAWIYYTRNPKAGNPLLDINVIGDARDMGDYTLVQDSKGIPVVSVEAYSPVDGYYFYYPNLSVRKDNTGAYISSIGAFGGRYYDDGNDDSIIMLKAAGFVSYLDYDFNYNTDYEDTVKLNADHYPIRIAYNRTSDVQAAITGILAVHNGTAVPEIVHNGITYYLANDTDLNASVGGDYIYLYYTKDAAAGRPITEIKGVDEYASYNEVVMRVDDVNEPSNFNAGTDTDDCDGSNSCYLAILRDNETSLTVKDNFWSMASVFSDNPKVVVIICMVLFMMLGAACTVILLKRRQKK